MMATIWLIASSGREPCPVAPRSTVRAASGGFLRAAPALAVPGIVILGMGFGLITPTEVGVLAVIYALVLGAIYREVRARLKTGGVFLNIDLVNAPSPELEQRYVTAAAARRQREAAASPGVESMAPRAEAATPRASGPFPADLAQQLAALRAAGFKDVDCFWRDLRRALFGGFA